MSYFPQTVDDLRICFGRDPQPISSAQGIKLGDLGSVMLKKGKASAVWKAGSTVEVAWAIRFVSTATFHAEPRPCR